MRLFLVLLGVGLALGPSARAKTDALEYNDPPEGVFSGRVAKANDLAALVRMKVDFINMRYVNKRDRVDLWSELNPGMRCKSYVAGKSNDYLLLKITDFKFCKRFLSFGPGSYLRMFSQDLVNNLTMGRELVGILVKKRLAIHGRLTERKKELESHIEKVNAVNSRYTVLRDKLEAEWRDELANLEEDRINSLRNYKDLEIQLADLNHKLERYQIGDDNLETDRWSLDSRLFFKK